MFFSESLFFQRRSGWLLVSRRVGIWRCLIWKNYDLGGQLLKFQTPRKISIEPENDGLVQMIFLFQGRILTFHVSMLGGEIHCHLSFVHHGSKWFANWWFQPICKICKSNWIISPNRDEHKKNWNHLQPFVGHTRWAARTMVLYKLQIFETTTHNFSLFQKPPKLRGFCW